MDKQDMVYVAAVLTAAAEFGGIVPATAVYMAAGCDWHRYERLAVMLATAGLITRPTQDSLHLTNKGAAVAAQINEALASA